MPLQGRQQQHQPHPQQQQQKCGGSARPPPTVSSAVLAAQVGSTWVPEASSPIVQREMLDSMLQGGAQIRGSDDVMDIHKVVQRSRELEGELTAMEQRLAALQGEQTRIQGHSKTVSVIKRKRELVIELEAAQRQLNSMRLQRRHLVHWDAQNSWAQDGIQNERGQGMFNYQEDTLKTPTVGAVPGVYTW